MFHTVRQMRHAYFIGLALLMAGRAPAAETMRIAMGPEQAVIVVEGAGLEMGDDSDESLFEPADNGHRAEVSLSAGRLVVDGKASDREAVRFRGSQQGDVSASGMRVHGEVVVLKGRSGLVAVNVLSLEAYLAGVLGGEMPPSYPSEALKAQAVAARTYALRKKLEQYGQPFHLGSSVLSQVYKGLEVADARTAEAVEATRGLVLTMNLEPIEAYFHASCGGRTETGANALGRNLPYLKSVDCPCGALAAAHWTARVERAELSQLLRKRVSEVEVLDRTPTGRARRMSVGGRAFDAVMFRQRLGYTKIRSLSFKVAPAQGGWRIDGQGYGHGAGLCQWGSKLYAQKGWGFERILAHYYPDTELQRLYE